MHTELRQAARALLRTPGFTLAAVLTLALGIGANATVFGALRAALLKTPAYPDPGRLLMLDLTIAHEGQTDTIPWSFPKFSMMRTAVTSVYPVAAFTTRELTIVDENSADRLKAEVVTPEYFTLLGIGAVRGRVFGPEAAESGEQSLVAVLTHRIWHQRFGANAAIVGRTVRLNGHPVTIIGIAAPEAEGLTGPADIWVPMAALPTLTWSGALKQTQTHSYQAVGRMAPGVTLPRVRAELTTIGQQVAETYPMDWGKGATYAATAVPFLEAKINPTGRLAVEVLAVAVGLVLLIGCVNLVNMLLARATSRTRELAIRSALGATRAGLTRTLLVETLLIAFAGGTLGLVFAAWGTSALAQAWILVAGPEGTRGLEFVNPAAVTLDVGLAVFALGLAMLTGLVLGLVAASRAAPAPAEVLRAGGTDTGRGLARGWRLSGRGILVAAQAGFCVVLLVGAGLTIRSVAHLTASPLGFEPANLITFRYRMSAGDIPPEQMTAVNLAIGERLASIPGVEHAAMDLTPPLTGEFERTVVTRIAGQPPLGDAGGPDRGSRGDSRLLQCARHPRRGRPADHQG